MKLLTLTKTLLLAVASTLMLVLVYLHTQGGVGSASLGARLNTVPGLGALGVSTPSNSPLNQGENQTSDLSLRPVLQSLGDGGGSPCSSSEGTVLSQSKGDRGNLNSTDAQNVDCFVVAEPSPRNDHAERGYNPAERDDQTPDLSLREGFATKQSVSASSRSGLSHNDTNGKVLGDSISLQPQPVDFSNSGLTEYQLNSIIAQQLTNLASIGLLGSPSNSSPAYNPTTYNSTTPAPSTSSGPATSSPAPVISYIQPAPAQNFNGASLFSATDLSSTRFTTTTANITDTATIKTLSVTENASIDGDLTITGNITGNVIGTINPSFTLGSIPFQGASNLTQDNANFFWDNTNKRLGVGTSSPSATVTVKAAAGVNPGIALDTTDTATNPFISFNEAGTNTWVIYPEPATHTLQLYNNATGYNLMTFTPSSKVGISAVTPASTLTIAGNASIGSSYQNVAAPSQGLIVEGNVGIGTTAPSQKLHVSGGVRVDGSTTPFIQLNDGTNNGYLQWASGVFNLNANTTNTDISITAGGGGTPVATFKSIQSGGNVGIGTTVPGQKLEVNGSSQLPTIYGSSTSNGDITIEGTSDSTKTTSDVRINPNGGRLLIGSATGQTGFIYARQDVNNQTVMRLVNQNSGAGAYVGTEYGNDAFAFSFTAYNENFNTFTHAGINLAGFGELYGQTTAGNGVQGLLIGLSANKPIVFANNDIERMRIAVGGNVGIGTTTPGAKLDVRTGAANVVGLNVQGAASQTARLQTWSLSNGNFALAVDANGKLQFGDPSGAVVPVVSVYGDANGKLIHEPLIGTYVPIVAKGATGQSANLQEWWNSSSTVLASISAAGGGYFAGNVGIGTTSPVGRLQVNGGNLRDDGYYSALEIQPKIGELYPSIVFAGQSASQYSTIQWTTSTSGSTANAVAANIAAIPTSSTNADLRFYTNNAIGTGNVSEKMRLLGSGNLGIGTTAPGGKLHVQGASAIFDYPDGNIRVTGTQGSLNSTDLGIFRAATNVFALADWNTASKGVFINTSSGNVGIGTTAPAYVLDVNGTGRFQDNVTVLASTSSKGLTITSSVSGNAGDFTIRPNSSAVGTPPDFTIATNASARIFFTSYAALFSGSITAAGITSTAGLGNTGLFTNNGNGKFVSSTTNTDNVVYFNAGTDANKAAIIQKALGSYSRNDLHFAFNNSTDLTNVAVDGTDTKVIFKADGNVGIGTTAPETKLHVWRTGIDGMTMNSSANLYLEQGDSGQNYIQFGGTSAQTQGVLFGSNAGGATNGSITYIHGSGTGSMQFSTASSERLRIDSSGNVGIGTTNPGATLTVFGATSNDQLRIGFAGDYNSYYKIGRSSSTGLLNFIGTQSGNDGYVFSVLTSSQTPLLIAASGDVGVGGVTPSGTGFTAANLTVKSGGNVGIGSTSPGFKLDVNGGIRLSSSNNLYHGSISLSEVYLGGIRLGTGASTIWAESATLGLKGPPSLTPASATLTGQDSAGNDGGGGSLVIRTGNTYGAGAATTITLRTYTTGAASNSPNGSTDVIFGYGTTTYNGNLAQTFSMARHTTSNTAGNNLIIQGGGATSAATDKNGGDLVLQSGQATGTGSSNITFKTHPAGSTGTTDTTATTAMTILGSGNVGIGTTSPLGKLDVAGATTLGNAIVIGRGTGGNSGVGAAIYAPDQATIQLAATNSGSITLKSSTIWATTDFVGGTIRPLTSNGDISFLDAYGGNTTLFIKGSNGNVGIGTTSPSVKLDVGGYVRAYSSTANVGISVNYTGASGVNYHLLSCSACSSGGAGTLEVYDATAGAGRAYIASGVNGWQTPSDRRLKTNIETFTVLDKLSGVRGTSYTLLDSGKTQIGVIAQELQQAFPFAVSGTESGTTYLGVSYDAVATIALQGVKELNEKLSTLQASIASLQGTGVDFYGSTPVVVQAQLYLSGDSVGQAKILAGSTSVRVTFSRPYEAQPIVTVTATGESALLGDYRYAVVEKDATGFTIKINNAQGTDLEFDYHVFASPEAKLTVSDGTSQNVSLVLGRGELQLPASTVTEDGQAAVPLEDSGTGQATVPVAGSGTGQAPTAEEETSETNVGEVAGESIEQSTEAGTTTNE